MSITVLSPHLDDAVLGLGQYLDAKPPATVITVFAGIPEGGFLGPYDRACGFESSRQAMERRRHEDVLACGMLDATAIHWDFLEAQYLAPPDRTAITEAIIAVLPKRPEDRLFAPLGLAHPDHRLLAKCARDAMQQRQPYGELYIYEELPARVDFPGEAARQLELLRMEGWRVPDMVAPLQCGSLDRKKQAIVRYVSQFPAGADNPAMLVGERAWRCSR